MKRAGFLLILLMAICLPISIAQTEYMGYKEAEMSLDISGEIVLEKETSQSYANYIEALLYFYPYEDSRQEIIDMDISEEGDIYDPYIRYRWDEPEILNEFYLKATVRTEEDFSKVKRKVAFPISGVDDELKVYTEPSTNIDSDNEAIIKKASELVEGEDDLFFVVGDIGIWIEENIEYDLNTLTAEANQKASWVLDNKEGVCDEITNLFIAMLRSLGIPARYASGLAYTNYLDKNDFGTHAWAEVYFPSYGWVNYDLTYNQFSYIDTSHIKLKESIDSTESTTKYEWEGYKVNVRTSGLEIDAELIDYTEDEKSEIQMESYPLKEEVGFGSYNLIKTKITNDMPYYIVKTLYISKSDKFDVVGEEKQHVILEPYGSKEVNWIIKLSRDLDNKYIYTFPVSVYAEDHTTSTLEFQAIDKGVVYTIDDITNILEGGEEEKDYSNEVEFGCVSDKEEYYNYEDINVDCVIKNTGNTYLEDLSVCYIDDCNTFNLGITQKREVYFQPIIMKTGKKEIAIIAKNNDIYKTERVEIEILDTPDVAIEEVTFPEEVRYDDEYDVSFIVKKTSDSIPYNVTVTISENERQKKWVIEELTADQKFVLNMKGQDLDIDENNVKIRVDYEDGNGKEYDEDKEINIMLVDVSLFQRMLIFLNNIGETVVGYVVRG